MTATKDELDLQAAVHAVDSWLTKARDAFDTWRSQQSSQDVVAADAAWQDVLQWHAALELSFTQLVEHLEDLTDLADARIARQEAASVTTLQGIRLLPTARERLRALAPQLQERLLQELHVHLGYLAKHPPLAGVERLPGPDGLFRMRLHDVRVLFELDQRNATIVAITPGHWQHPRHERVSAVPAVPGAAGEATRVSAPAV